MRNSRKSRKSRKLRRGGMDPRSEEQKEGDYQQTMRPVVRREVDPSLLMRQPNDASYRPIETINRRSGSIWESGPELSQYESLTGVWNRPDATTFGMRSNIELSPEPFARPFIRKHLGAERSFKTQEAAYSSFKPSGGRRRNRTRRHRTRRYRTRRYRTRR